MRGRLIWGLSLIAIGAFFLMQQLGWFGAMQFPFWAFAFGLLGMIFLVNFVGDRRQWWALIPGCIMLGLAVVILNRKTSSSRTRRSVRCFCSASACRSC